MNWEVVFIVCIREPFACLHSSVARGHFLTLEIALESYRKYYGNLYSKLSQFNSLILMAPYESFENTHAIDHWLTLLGLKLERVFLFSNKNSKHYREEVK